MLARSFAPSFWALLGAAHPHDNHLLTPPVRWKVCLRQISRTPNGIQRAATKVMVTTLRHWRHRRRDDLRDVTPLSRA